MFRSKALAQLVPKNFVDGVAVGHSLGDLHDLLSLLDNLLSVLSEDPHGIPGVVACQCPLSTSHSALVLMRVVVGYCQVLVLRIQHVVGVATWVG